MNTKADMAAFGASDAACYKWPADTELDKACRAAFCEGAAWVVGPHKKKQHELVGFLAMWAVDYEKRYKLNGLHPEHYRLMKKYGARMDDFKIATNSIASFETLTLAR